MLGSAKMGLKLYGRESKTRSGIISVDTEHVQFTIQVFLTLPFLLQPPIKRMASGGGESWIICKRVLFYKPC